MKKQFQLVLFLIFILILNLTKQITITNPPTNSTDSVDCLNQAKVTQQKVQENLNINKLNNYIAEVKFTQSKINFERSSILFLNSIHFPNVDQLYSDINCKTTNFSERNYISRLFSYIYTQEIEKSLITYKPKGVVVDKTENLTGLDNWKIFSVLLEDSNSNHKVLKVCVHTGIYIGVVSNFDVKVTPILEKLQNLVKVDNNLTLELELLRKQISKAGLFNDDNDKKYGETEEEVFIKEYIDKKFNKDKKIVNFSNSKIDDFRTSSFLNTKESYGFLDQNYKNNTQTIDLTEKLSVDDLINIKSLIYFAKKNGLIKQIFETKGNFTVFHNNESHKDFAYLNNTLSNINKKLDSLEEFIHQLKSPIVLNSEKNSTEIVNNNTNDNLLNSIELFIKEEKMKKNLK